MRAGMKRNLIIFAVFLAAVGAVLLCVAFSHQTVPVYVVERTGDTAQESSAMDTAEEKLNINEATREELEALPGIGEVLAERILAYRRECGAFYDVGELREVEGIGDRMLQNLLPYICV